MPTSTVRTISFKHSPRARGAASINLGSDFGQGISTLTEQVRYLQDQEALDKLPTDPAGFIDYAKKRASQLGSDPDAKVWNELVKRAQFKVDELSWQQGIRDGSKTLEGFNEYLTQRFQNAAPGSVEAQQALSDMESAQRAIAAKGENTADQQALFGYMQSKDYDTYGRYLQSKLARATNPQVQAVILSQIKDLQGRADRAKQTERTQQRSQIVTDYMKGTITASQAVSKLQALTIAAGITPGEVSSITSEISQIINRERSGSGSGAADKAAQEGVATKLRLREADYTAAKAAIQKAIDSGREPTPEEQSRLNTATELLQATYGEVADLYASKGDSASVKVWTDRQNALPELNRQLAYTVDKSIIGDANGVATTFLKGISQQDTKTQITSIAAKVRKLNEQVLKIKTDQGRTDLQNAIATLQAQADALINKTKTADVTPSKDQTAAMNHQYEVYKQRYETEDTTTVTKLSETDFQREVRYSNDAKEFSASAGIIYTPEQFAELKGVVAPTDTRATDAQTLQDLYNFNSNPINQIQGTNQSPDAYDRNLGKPSGTVGPSDPAAPEQGKKGLASVAAPEAVPPDAAVDPAAQASLTAQDQAIPPDQMQPAQIDIPEPSKDDGPDSRTLNDFLDTAVEFLDEPTPIDIPDFGMTTLPDLMPFDSAIDIGTVDQNRSTPGDGSTVNFNQ